MHYGPFALFFFLMFGIIALPVPEETLMVISGVLVGQGKLNGPWVVVAVVLGSMCGITSSYLIGRLASNFFINRVGKWFRIPKKRFDQAHAWFEKYGKWSLPVGYFIPGIRHLGGFTAGMTKLHFRDFAIFAYAGAILWTSTFLSIGYFFGEYYLCLFQKMCSKF